MFHRLAVKIRHVDLFKSILLYKRLFRLDYKPIIFIPGVDAVFDNILWQRELYDHSLLIHKESHNIDLIRSGEFLKDKLVFRDVPVADRLTQGLFEKHVTLPTPHLEQEFEIVIFDEYFWVNYLYKYGTEKSILVVITAADNFVKFAERHRKHDFFHEFLRCFELLSFKFVLPVGITNLKQVAVHNSLVLFLSSLPIFLQLLL